VAVLTDRSRGAPVRRVLLIVNPASRSGALCERRVVHALRGAGASAEVARTTGRGAARGIAAERAAEFDAVLTLGGDGTAVEVLDALAHRGPPVGVLPAGTGNLLARALGVPLRIGAAVRALLRGNEARVDLGVLNGGPRFVVGAGVGIDASMIATTTGVWKRRAGVAAYVVTGTRAVLAQRRFDVRVTIDGITIERTASSVFIANFGTLLHGLITVGPGILPDDGALDVCIFDPPEFGDAVRIARRLVLRKFEPDPAITYRSGRDILIETESPLPVQADGDLVGESPLRARVDPLAALVLVPNRQINRQ